jgi:hypothetical protein
MIPCNAIKFKYFFLRLTERDRRSRLVYYSKIAMVIMSNAEYRSIVCCIVIITQNNHEDRRRT